MPLSRFRLGAGSFAAGSLAVIVGRLVFGRPRAPALPAPGSTSQNPREWEAGQGAKVALADPSAHNPSKGEGHAAPDLAADADPRAGRAPEAFRPDPTAVPTAAEREALRPAPPLESAAQAVATSERAEAV